MSEPSAPSPNRPARYDRSFGGLLAAMIVTVVVVGGYVGFRALTRDQPDVINEVDYLADVTELQGSDIDVVYPCSVPDGWYSSSTDFTPGAPPQWGIGFVTDDEEFVGIRQEDADVDDLLATYVDETPKQGGDAAPVNQLGAATWQTWSDAGGDHAFSTTLPAPLAGQTLLVYGSASVAQQEQLIQLLTTGPTGSC